MTNTTTSKTNQITIGRMIGLFAVLAWAALVIGGPLALALLVKLPAGQVGVAVANIALAAIMSAPWCVFGLPVVRAFVRDLI